MSSQQDDPLQQMEDSIPLPVGKEKTVRSNIKDNCIQPEEISYNEEGDDVNSGISREKFNPNSHTKQTYICGGCSASFNRLRSLKRHRCCDGDTLNALDKAEIESSKSQMQVDGLKEGDNTMEGENTDLNSDVAVKSTGDSKTPRTNQKSFKCSICPKKYTKLHYLTKHFAMKHSGIMPWRCPSCCEEFTSSVKFKEHCKQHDIAKPFRCDKCGSYFTSYEVLRVHDRTHTGERPFSCETCGKKFKQSSNLQDHIRKHKNDRSFICGTCGKSFNLKGDLTKHLMLHTGERKYRCCYCPMAFPGVSNLNRHMRTHTGVKPFTCSHCKKSFPRKERLREHERIHTGEKPFTCPICQKTFSDSGNFSNHKKGHEDASLQKWKRFPKRVTTKPLTPPSSDDHIVQVPIGNEDLGKTESFSSTTQSQPLNVFLALPSQVVYYENTQIAEPLVYIVNREINGKMDSNLGQVEVSSTLQQDQQFSINLGVQKEAESSSQLAADRAAETPLCAISTSVPDANTLSSIKNCESVSHISDDNLVSFDFDRSVEGLTFSDSFSLPENCHNTALTPTKFLPALKPLFESGSGKLADSPEKEDGEKLMRSLEDTNSTAGEKKDDCKSLGLMLPAVSGIVGECSSNLTLLDLTKTDETHSFTCQSNFLLTHDGKSEQRKLGGILLATPTKSYPEEKDQSPTSMICSQVLVTPEHALLPSEVVDASKVKRRVLGL